MTNSEDDNNQVKSSTDSWIVGATIFICLAFIAICLAFLLPFHSNKTHVSHIEISLALPADSVKQNKSWQTNYEILDSLKNCINRQEKELNQNYDLFMKARQEDTDLIKFISCIGAFVIALLSVFGIKNFRDLKSNIEESVKLDVHKQIRSTITTKLKSAIRDQITKEVTRDTYKKNIKEELIGDLNSLFGEELNSYKEKTDKKIDLLTEEMSILKNHDSKASYSYHQDASLGNIVQESTPSYNQQDSDLDLSIAEETD